MDNPTRSDTDYLDQLAAEIKDKLGWGPVSDWTQRNFQGLSDLLEQKTNERVSVTTLKRAMGRLKRKTVPHLKTLNNLARFADYENWTHYKITTEGRAAELGLSSGDEPLEITREQAAHGHPDIIVAEANPQTITGTQQTYTPPVRKRKAPLWRKALIAAEVLLIALALWYLVSNLTDNQKTDTRQAQKNSSLTDKNKPLSGDNTISLKYNKFDYDKNEFVVNVEYYLPDINIENVNLIRFDDRLGYLPINPDTKQGLANHTYNERGFIVSRYFLTAKQWQTCLW